MGGKMGEEKAVMRRELERRNAGIGLGFTECIQGKRTVKTPATGLEEPETTMLGY